METMIGLALTGLVITLFSVNTGVDAETTFVNNSTIFTGRENQLFLIQNTTEWIKGQEFNSYQIQLPSAEYIHGLAYDYRSNLLVLSDPYMNTLVMLNTSTCFYKFLHIGTSPGVGQLTVDWLGRNVYWTDSVYGWIALVHLPVDMDQYNEYNKEFKVIADKYLENPTGIAVHPHKRYLFWADAGINPKIERSDLVGNQRTIIKWSGLIKPTTLCIDQTSDRLFWSDQSRGTIEYSDFDGTNRRILVSDTGLELYGITIFQDVIMATVPSKNLTRIYSRGTGEMMEALPYTAPFYYVDIFSKEEQQRDANEVCDSAECDHICLHTSIITEKDSGYSCLCNDGYRLNINRKTCEADTDVLQRYLVYTNDSHICAVSINLLNTFQYIDLEQKIDCNVVSVNTIIKRFAMDIVDNSMFYTDGHSIYKQLAYSNQRQQFYATKGTISDVDYNWKTKHIVWAEPIEGRIMNMVGSSIGEDAIVLVDNIAGLYAVAVDPHNSRIYWTSNNGLNVRYENGTSTAINTVHMNKPTDLEYDRLGDRLIWINDGGYISTIHTDGTDEIKWTYKCPAQMEAVTVYKKYIIITTTGNEDVLFEVIQEDSLPPTTIKLHNISSININDVHVFDITLQPSDLEACETDNGGCEHMCLPQNNGMCACILGYDLATDGKACKTTVKTSDFIMVLDAVNNDVYQLVAATNEIHSLKLAHGYKPIAVTYDAARNQMVWVDEDSLSVKFRLLPESSDVVIGSDVVNTSRVAVDTTSGNIYVTTSASIKLFASSGQVVTLLSGSDISGTPGQIEVIPAKGIMVWIETGSATRIMKANMDGSVVKRVVSDSSRIQSPRDIAVDFSNTDDGYSLYWCDSELDKIDRVNIDTFSTMTIHSVHDSPIAIDVSGDYVYFIGEGHRHISRINKADGGDFSVVMELAAFGTLSSLYVWKPPPPGNDYCHSGNCNGGCSTICLPQSSGRKCACSDGTTTGSDGKTCTNVNRCSALDSVKEFHSWHSCCLEVTGSICDYTCNAGFAASRYPLLCDKSGDWNVTADDICTAEACETNNGGCEHMCLPQNNSMCACIIGYDLATDGKTCKTTAKTSDFIMVIDALNNDVYQLVAATNEIHAIKHAHDHKPIAVTYDAARDLMVWVDEGSLSVKVRRLPKSSDVVIGSDVVNTSRVAVDTTSGNIYVTTATSIKLFVSSGRQVVTLLSGSDIIGTPGQIEVIPAAGIMVWIETGSATRIMKANMDGSLVKRVVSGSSGIQSPRDIAVDFSNTDDGYSLYWCDSELDKIDRVNIDTFSTETIHSVHDSRPIAIDVSGDYVYFIGEGHRHISRINKADGGDFSVVMELAAFGSLSSLYVWKPPPPGNDYCGNCNGGCSTICLPQSSRGKCACSDGTTTGSDGKTCTNVNRCSALESVKGFHSWHSCCLEVTGSICNYTCNAWFAASSYPLLCDKSGDWNVTADDICTADVVEVKQWIMYAGAIGGAVLLLLCIVGVVVLCRRRHGKRFGDSQRRPSTLPGRLQVQVAESRNSSNESSFVQRDIQELNEQAEYTRIDDTARNSKPTHPPLRANPSNTSSKSGRYGPWPTSGDDYLHARSVVYNVHSPNDGEYNQGYIEFIGEGFIDSAVGASSQPPTRDASPDYEMTDDANVSFTYMDHAASGKPGPTLKPRQILKLIPSALPAHSDMLQNTIDENGGYPTLSTNL